jgi:probable rRNA maturation factor
MGKVKVLIKNTQKDVKIPTGIRLLIRRCCHAALLSEGIDAPAEVSVSFVNNAQIRELNAKYRNIDRETDVLSFPQMERSDFEHAEQPDTYVMGDIVISMEKAVAQAAMYGHSIEREIAFLTVHSMFHLLGYDHEGGGLKAVQMREKEENVLLKLGLSRGSSYVMEDE